MKPGGYTTSSKLVNKIIKEEGLDSFEVVEIVHREDVPKFKTILEYEIHRLRLVDAKSNSEYLNMTNGIFTRHQKPIDHMLYNKLKENDAYIQFSPAEKSITWMFDIEHCYSDRPRNKNQVAEVNEFLRTRAYSKMNPEEVGLPPSFDEWSPDILDRVLIDLRTRFGIILSIQRKRRNFNNQQGSSTVLPWLAQYRNLAERRTWSRER
jgi:hypothetical protein